MFDGLEFTQNLKPLKLRLVPFASKLVKKIEDPRKSDDSLDFASEALKCRLQLVLKSLTNLDAKGAKRSVIK